MVETATAEQSVSSLIPRSGKVLLSIFFGFRKTFSSGIKRRDVVLYSWCLVSFKLTSFRFNNINNLYTYCTYRHTNHPVPSILDTLPVKVGTTLYCNENSWRSKVRPPELKQTCLVSNPKGTSLNPVSIYKCARHIKLHQIVSTLLSCDRVENPLKRQLAILEVGI